MTKPINDYTIDELSAKIEAIKAERERTAEALKKYEEELERRKQEMPLGVPLEDIMQAHIAGVYKYFFASESSKLVFDKWIKEYVKALQKLAKGEPIDIQVLLPLMRKGWVAMDENGDWFWFKDKPSVSKECWRMDGWCFYKLVPFNLKPAKNWETSLMECGL